MTEQEETHCKIKRVAVAMEIKARLFRRCCYGSQSKATYEEDAGNSNRKSRVKKTNNATYEEDADKTYEIRARKQNKAKNVVNGQDCC